MNEKSRVGQVAATAVLLAASGSVAQAGEIVFGGGSNFREVRGGNVPLNFTMGDNLGVGATITDSDTGLRPENGIVKARNTVTGETFVLNADGPDSYFSFIPYTAGRASGDWTLEVQSNVGNATGSLAAFGTGPGTGPIPLVQNLQATGSGTTRGLTWTTPAGVVDQTANDGNIGRLRARLTDSNGRQIVDDRGLGVGNTASLGETSYQFDPSVISHNGAYVGQMLVEGFTPFSRSRAFETFVVDDLTGLGGTPVTVTGTSAFRDFRGENSVRFREGDQFSLGAFVDVFDDTWIHAEQDGLIVPLRQSSELDRRFEYFASMPFDDALTDPWTIVAFNGDNKTTVQTSVLDASAPLDLVRNIAITPDDLTPTVSWTLPDDPSTFDRVQIGLFDDESDLRLSVFGSGQDQLFENLAADATSFKFAAGQLEFDRQYVVRVVLADDDDTTGNLANRSVSFFNFSAIEGTETDPIFLPTVDTNGVFNFDFDVEAATPIRIDPFVAIGYDYAIGAGDPLFASVLLPTIGDDLFDLWLFDDLGNPFDSGLDLLAGVEFDLTTLGTVGGIDYANGAERFRILGIETDAMLDPGDVTAFVTTVTFVSSGRFTGTMTPITVFVETPEPPALALLLGGLLALARGARSARRRR